MQLNIINIEIAIQFIGCYQMNRRYWWGCRSSICKASAIKNAILVFAFWNGPFICYLERLFMAPSSPDKLSRKKFDRECSSEVCKMFGCLKRKFENCIFIRERLMYIICIYIPLNVAIRVHACLYMPANPASCQTSTVQCLQNHSPGINLLTEHARTSLRN